MVSPLCGIRRRSRRAAVAESRAPDVRERPPPSLRVGAGSVGCRRARVCSADPQPARGCLEWAQRRIGSPAGSRRYARPFDSRPRPRKSRWADTARAVIGPWRQPSRDIHAPRWSGGARLPLRSAQVISGPPSAAQSRWASRCTPWQASGQPAPCHLGTESGVPRSTVERFTVRIGDRGTLALQGGCRVGPWLAAGQLLAPPVSGRCVREVRSPDSESCHLV